MFESIDQVIAQLREQQYICDRRLATVIFLALKMQKPVLIEGPAGVGKTELAKVVARALERRLIRLQCYEGLDEARALYEWEYSKQLLYTQILREKIGRSLEHITDLRDAVEQIRHHEDAFFSEHFIVRRPILQAIASPEPVVLLIDEVDRAEEQFEAFLLEVLSDFQVSIPEIGTISATSPPAVIITSNNTRELSEALKRRCLHLSIGYPGEERELEIVRLKVPEISEALARQVVELIRNVRALDLRKAPSISETLDWARALILLNAESLTPDLVEETLQLILKYDRDVQKVSAELPRLLGGAPGEHHHHDHDHHHHHHDAGVQAALDRQQEHTARYFTSYRDGSRS
ncbi:MAG: MoxR family ATPase [Chloroflexales bacterium]|nr:MoxR family ATPase [Chloroflexales bacterium]